MSNSNNKYNPKEIENKLISTWNELNLFQNETSDPLADTDEKYYMHFAFSYPSGSGLHVGHAESHTALDIVARYKRMNGVRVFIPEGWDSFGLPAEKYAIKTGIHPSKNVEQCANRFKEQLDLLGVSKDWSAELFTSSPSYYKWTQWIFTQLYKDNLAYKKASKANWCPSCKTVLANAQVIQGLCERCDNTVIQKDIEQWFLKITEYSDEYITGLDSINWPNRTKLAQKNWVGKSKGAEIAFKIKDSKDIISIFTTRPDTIFGVSYMAIAPEHPLLEGIENAEIKKYIQKSKNKTDLERQQNKEKTGIFTGLYVIHPFTKEEIPVWVTDYVLMGYGTGAIMAVPAHDARDFEFANKFDLPILPILDIVDFDSSIWKDIYSKKDSSKLINSSFLNSLSVKDAISRSIKKIEELKIGKSKTTYRLKDWSIARQRYWGAPIPIVYDPEGKAHAIPKEHLPWLLPTDVDFKNLTGKSPLADSKELFERTENIFGKGWIPEVDTMDTFVDSSWYFLRYPNVNFDDDFIDKKLLKKWGPTDFYMIGSEHTVLHLLYSRFFTKYFFKKGWIDFDEPFPYMYHQGIVMGTDGKRMSKSRGNIINPDDVIKDYGADTLRVYEMFMGPLDADKVWSDAACNGVYRFVNRFYKIIINSKVDSLEIDKVESELQKLIKKVTEDIPNLKFNTSIALMMEFVNLLMSNKDFYLTKDQAIRFCKIFAPFAPFINEELYQNLNNYEKFSSIHKSNWPKYDESKVLKEGINLPIQINGKVKAEIIVSEKKIADKEYVLNTAKEKIVDKLQGKNIIKEIYVPKRIINFVIK